jgi:hypothetical protein
MTHTISALELLLAVGAFGTVLYGLEWLIRQERLIWWAAERLARFVRWCRGLPCGGACCRK